MAQSLAKILVHLVFSTKDRHKHFHKPAHRDELHRYLGGILAQLDCQPVVVGGVEDHVHFLFALSRTLTVADLVKELKRSSAIWLKANDPQYSEFSWQSGYGIFSIAYSQIEAVRAYICNQEEHHRKMSYQDEVLTLLKKYDVPFDERYLWQ